MDPINAGRESTALPQQIALGQNRLKQLQKITNTFILRRTAEVNESYLPPKKEIVVFTKMTKSQSLIYASASCNALQHLDSGALGIDFFMQSTLRN